jgi:hypothetical protein
MNIKAFNINSEINEKEFYPEDYILDNALDNDVLDFFNSQKNNKSLFPKKELIKDNIENEMDIENEEEEEDSSESSELIYSSFPDNITKAKNQIYENMHIEVNIIKSIIDEYNKVKNKFLNDYKNISINNNALEKDKFIFNINEFDKYDNTPNDEFIKRNILPFKSNGYLMKNINKSFKALKTFNKTNKNEINKLSQWIYSFLLFLEPPLSPEYCADLYSINKYIYNNFMKSSELKIIFVIICEIFKQILIL